VFIQNLSNDICCPFFDGNNNLHFIYQNSGDIMMVNELEKVERVHTTHGQPSGAIHDSDGVLYVADFAHGAILAVQPEGSQDVVVGVYEDKPLKGPNTIVKDCNGNIFFTDSGPFGETGLDAPAGSLFAIVGSSSGQILKPLCLESLAYPSGVTVSPNGKFVYAYLVVVITYSLELTN
jgi:sugar lactone lactonase YvrE